MFVQVFVDGMPHRIKNKIDSLAASQFRGRYKIAVARNQDDLVNLLLIRQGGNIQPDSHINALLANIVLEVRKR